MIPVGVCQCGCGLRTRLAPDDDARCGHVRGRPIRFINGHNRRSGLTPEQRFWTKAEKTKSCWIWTGAQTSTGYGLFNLSRHARNFKTHRLAWILSRGKIPDGMCVLHKCDVPLCVNPDHLFLGTLLDNSKDAKSKGRNNIGDRNGMAKLTPQIIKEIRNGFVLGQSRKYLAEKFDTCRSNVGLILNRRSWKHVQ